MTDDEVRVEEIEMPYKEYIISDSKDSMDNGVFRFAHQWLRRVRYKFPNGWGASVVMGELYYSRLNAPFEACPTKGDKLWYDAVEEYKNDVYAYHSEEELYILLPKLLVKEKCNE